MILACQTRREDVLVGSRVSLPFLIVVAQRSARAAVEIFETIFFIVVVIKFVVPIAVVTQRIGRL